MANPVSITIVFAALLFAGCADPPLGTNFSETEGRYSLEMAIEPGLWQITMVANSSNPMYLQLGQQYRFAESGGLVCSAIRSPGLEHTMQSVIGPSEARVTAGGEPIGELPPTSSRTGQTGLELGHAPQPGEQLSWLVAIAIEDDNEPAPHSTLKAVGGPWQAFHAAKVGPARCVATMEAANPVGISAGNFASSPIIARAFGQSGNSISAWVAASPAPSDEFMLVQDGTPVWDSTIDAHEAFVEMTIADEAALTGRSPGSADGRTTPTIALLYGVRD